MKDSSLVSRFEVVLHVEDIQRLVMLVGTYGESCPNTLRLLSRRVKTTTDSGPKNLRRQMLRYDLIWSCRLLRDVHPGALLEPPLLTLPQ